MKRSAVSIQPSALQSITLAPSHRTHRRGVALMDVLVAGIMLAIGLAVVISLVTRSLRIQTDSEKQLTASWLADELLAMVVVEGPENFNKKQDTNGRYEFPFDEFEFDVQIDDQGQTQPYSVTATVSWPSGRGYKNVQAHTFIDDRKSEPEQEQRIPLEPVDRDARWYPEED
jgi:hypothetical protein